MKTYANKVISNCGLNALEQIKLLDVLYMNGAPVLLDDDEVDLLKDIHNSKIFSIFFCYFYFCFVKRNLVWGVSETDFKFF